MKKNRIIIVLVCAAALCEGCSANRGGQQKLAADSQTSVIEEIQMTTLTEQEKELLIAAYGHGEEIQDGQLYNYQREALEQLRAGAAYLERRYPDLKTDILSLEPANKFTPWAVLRFQTGPVDEYRLTVTPSAEGFICADTYFGEMIRDRYDLFLGQQLRERGYSVQTWTMFSTPVGEDVPTDVSVKGFLELYPRIPRDTHLFVQAPAELDAVKIELQKIMKEEGLYGSYAVYLVPEDLYTDRLRMEKNRENYMHTDFQCFDI